ncbi:MAG TPA: hypothetical protein VGK78_18925 [Nocardioides sp.]|uniref:hypothetical protein n=1 Tax=Nocardioides sp. TaxID=35761 RepID=UPI002F42CDFA
MSRTTPALRPQAAAVSAPWRALCPPSARLLRDPTADQVRRAPAGERLVLVSDRPLGRSRLRRAARRGGLVTERELLVLPGTRRTLVTIDEHPTAVRLLWENVAAVPPGLTWASLPVSLAVRLARRLPWQWTGSVLGGHVLIGRGS